MATKKLDAKFSYPLPVYNYRVIVDDVPMSFSEVSGIKIEHETQTYRHGLSYWEGEELSQYYYEKYQTITLKKGTMQGVNFLYDWLKDKETLKRSMHISLCDEKGEPVVTWTLGKVVPIKLDAPSFTAESNDVAIESLEVMATRISIEHIDAGS